MKMNLFKFETVYIVEIDFNKKQGGEDVDTFETHIHAVFPVLERYVKYRLNNCNDAEDVLQDICLTAFLKYDQLQKKDSFKAWILSIARNSCTDYFRKMKNRREVPLEEIPEAILVYSRRGWVISSPVEDTLERLSDRDREILNLFYWQQLTIEEISKKLGIPVGTVKSRLNTARERFKNRYPYPPEKLKGDFVMKKLPEIMPYYTIKRLEEEPFSVKWEEVQGWLIVPKLGEKLCWGSYDYPERRRMDHTEMEVVGKAEIHGIEGVEIVAVQYGADAHDTGVLDRVERRFVAQLTDTHCRYLAESHMEHGVRKNYTFLDEEFLRNWGFGGEDNCGNEVNLTVKGQLQRDGNEITARQAKEVLDIAGRYAVTISGKTYDTVCVMDIEFYNEAVVSEQFVDRNGRTVLWRRFNRDDWASERFGGKLWSERLPNNEQLIINGDTYVHWYDCITDYIL